MKNISLIFIAIILSYSSLSAQWVQIGEDIGGESAQELSGTSIDLSTDGQTIAIGALTNSDNGYASGEVRVFNNVDGSWTQLGGDMNGVVEQGNFGSSVSISGDGTRVAIGATGYNGVNGLSAGQVRVFELTDGEWTQLGDDFDGDAEGDVLGTEVSLSEDGKILAMSAELSDAVQVNAGLVRIFQEIEGEWIQMGEDLLGTLFANAFGSSISVSGNGEYVAIGARMNSYDGFTRIYEYSDETWVQVGSDLSGTVETEGTGMAVRLNYDGSVVVLSTPFNASTTGGPSWSGRTMVFQSVDNEWEQVGENIYGETENELSGSKGGLAISDDGLTIAIGSKNQSIFRGAARVFTFVGGMWVQQGETLIGENSNDYFGQSISLSADGSILAVGADKNDDFGGNAGKTQIFELVPTGIYEAELKDARLFPNPSSGIVRIELNQNLQNVSINIYDALGKKVKTEQRASSSSIGLALPEMKGLYFIHLTSERMETKTLKVMKE